MIAKQNNATIATHVHNVQFCINRIIATTKNAPLFNGTAGRSKYIEANTIRIATYAHCTLQCSQLCLAIMIAKNAQLFDETAGRSKYIEVNIIHIAT